MSFWLTFPRLNSFLLHGQWPRDVVKLVIKSARITHWLSLTISAPQSCRRRVTIVTTKSTSSVARRLKSPNDQRRDEKKAEEIVRYQSLHFKSINSGTKITADGALAFGILFAGRGALFCLLYSAHRLHKLWPMLSRRHSGVSELAQLTFRIKTVFEMALNFLITSTYTFSNVVRHH